MVQLSLDTQQGHNNGVKKMIAIIGSLVGLFGGILPDVINLFKRAGDRKNELKMLDRRQQIDAEDRQVGREADRDVTLIKKSIAAIEAQNRETVALLKHDSQPLKSGVVEGYRASVRPTLAYGVFAVFLAVGLGLVPPLQGEWGQWLQGSISVVMAFYFGSRAMDKARGK